MSGAAERTTEGLRARLSVLKREKAATVLAHFLPAEADALRPSSAS